MAASGTPLKIKRLRQRFGIGAPRVAVRAHIAWRWRLLIAVGVVLVAVLLAAWVYDAGRRVAGFDSQQSAQTIEQLQKRVASLESELGSIRGLASTADSSLKIERVAQQQLAQQVKVLETENAALKQDLAFFEGLVPGSEESEPGVRIDRLRIEPNIETGNYRFRMLLVHNATRQQKTFSGGLRFFITVMQKGKNAIIAVPPADEAEASKSFAIEVRNFRRAEGSLPIAADAVLKRVEVHVVDASGSIRARQTINF